MAARSVTVEVPSTCGNFGPGFDVLSLALAGPGEAVTVSEADGDHIRLTGRDIDSIPGGWRSNVAGVAIDALRKATGHSHPVRVELEKRTPPASGLGSSASSAAGAVLGYLALFGDQLEAPPTPEVAIEAAAAGQAVASGMHHDDPAAAILGGLAVVSATDRGHRFRRLDPPRPFHLGILTPHLRLETRAMRAAVPGILERDDVVATMGGLAQLLSALSAQDVPGVIQALEMDRISRPHRTPHIPGFLFLRKAALDAGAEGILLCGSGPSIAACSTEPDVAEQAVKAMAEALEAEDLEGTITLTEPDRREVFTDVVLSRL